jgi:hypothetical protein
MSITTETFINHIIFSNKIRVSFSADILLDFIQFTQYHYTENDTSNNFNKFRTPLKLLKVIKKSNKFTNEFIDTLEHEYTNLIVLKKEQNIINKAKDDYINYHMNIDVFDDGNTTTIPVYFYNKVISHINPLKHSIKDYETRWNNLTDDEKIIWIKPSNLKNTYTKWFSRYSPMIREAYPNINDNELISLAKYIWGTIKNYLNFYEFREYYHYKAPYIRLPETFITESVLKNIRVLESCLENYKKAVNIIEKFMYIRRFIKLCNSKSFNEFFWNPNNIGGHWHINKMTKMLSEL